MNLDKGVTMVEGPNDNQMPRRATAAVLVRVGTYWYITSLLAGLGFSFGLYLLRPDTRAVRGRQDILEALALQDGHWYKEIATGGYRFSPDARSNAAFFPIYPLLARALISATGIAPELALIVTSNISFLAALVLIAIYARDRYANAAPELPDYAVIAAAVFPTGCFFRLAYSESTCLLLIVLAMYAMLRRWPIWAIALLVGLATAARAVGIALLGPFIIHLCRVTSDGEQRTLGARRTRSAASPNWSKALDAGGLPLRRIFLRLTVCLPVACWGLASFVSYHAHAFGDALTIFKAHDNWRLHPALDWKSKAICLASLEPLRSVYDSTSTSFWAARDPHAIAWFSLQFANPLFFLAAIAVIVYGQLRGWLSPEEASLGALALLIPYVTRGYEMGMSSMGRFVAVDFPVYLVLGQLLARAPCPFRAIALVIPGFYLAAYLAMYAAERLVF